MHEFRSLIRAIVLLLLVVFAVSSLHAQDGLSLAFSRLDSVRDLSSEIVGPAVATADFNNDRHPDGAVLFRNHNIFQIEVHFRFHRVSKISFASKFPTLTISALDVNNDGNPDLVVQEPFSRHRLFVWLNDGCGSFRSVRVASYPTGLEDGYHTFAEPSGGPQSPAMAVPGKLRVRYGPSSSIRIAAPASLLCFRPQETFHPAEFASAPNLLRGPPNTALL
ncbi:MAG TPA: VCBS repeat-containing protein [Terracidiphilus sp.]|jgi:hypothetical protein